MLGDGLLSRQILKRLLLQTGAACGLVKTLEGFQFLGKIIS